MSYTSLFEEAARNTAAITLLNKYRHVLQGRSGIVLNPNEKKTIIEALTINEPKNLSKAIIYSLQGSGNDLSGSIPSIGRAIKKALQLNQNKNLPELIRNSINGKKLSPEHNDDETIKFIEIVMGIVVERDGDPAKTNPLDINDGNF